MWTSHTVVNGGERCLVELSEHPVCMGPIGESFLVGLDWDLSSSPVITSRFLSENLQNAVLSDEATHRNAYLPAQYSDPDGGRVVTSTGIITLV